MAERGLDAKIRLALTGCAARHASTTGHLNGQGLAAGWIEDAEGRPRAVLEQFSAAVPKTVMGVIVSAVAELVSWGCASRPHHCRSAMSASEERQQLLLQAAGLQHQPLVAEQAQPQDHRVDVAFPLPAMLQMLA